MIRLIGILTGSAIAIGLLIVTLGIPEIPQGDPEQMVVATEPPDAGVAATAPDPEPVKDALPPAEPEPVGGGLPATDPVPEPEPDPVESDLHAMLTDEQLVEQIFAPQPAPALAENWYAFWSPFRSEIAANGFVSRLQQTTGMDYRVVKLKPGVYEVAFAYSDEDDIEHKLARISAATGLDMSGG